LAENWWLRAQGFGYKTPKEMFEDLYLVQKQSIIDIAVRCEVSKQCILKKLKEFNIPRRAHGGINHTSIAYDLQDQIDFNKPTGDLCSKLNVSRRTILRLRRKQNLKNSTIVDKSSELESIS
jgi:hypothetical protein